MLGGISIILAKGEFIGGPFQWKAIDDFGEVRVGGGSAPEDEVRTGDVFGGNFGVFDDARFAAELAAPFADGALGFLFDPGIDFVVAGGF